jgi:hypothetical protein
LQGGSEQGVSPWSFYDFLGVVVFEFVSVLRIEFRQPCNYTAAPTTYCSSNFFVMPSIS